MPEQVVRITAVAPAHLDDVAEAARAEEADQRPAVLEQRVQADRRAVQEVPRGGDITIGQHRVEHAEHALVRSVGDRWHLADYDPPGLLVAEHEIGECPADVDCDPVWHGGTLTGAKRQVNVSPTQYFSEI